MRYDDEPPAHVWYTDGENYDHAVVEALENDEDRNILEPRSAWLHRVLAESLLPTRTDARVVPDPAARVVDPASGAPATPPVGAPTPF